MILTYESLLWTDTGIVKMASARDVVDIIERSIKSIEHATYIANKHPANQSFPKKRHAETKMINSMRNM